MHHLVHHLLRSGTAKDGSKECIVHRNERLSYAQLNLLTNRLANAMLEAGLKRGDRVAVFLEKSINEVVSLFAISKAGGVFVPVNQLLFPEQVAHILNDCKVSGLITSGMRLRSLREILSTTPSLKFVISSDKTSGTEMTQCLLNLNSVLENASNKSPQDVSISNDLAAILYTSGSTGRPKGVMLSHGNLLAGSRIVSSYLEISDKDRILSILPFSFDYGLNQLLTAVEHCGTLVLLFFRFPDEVVQALLNEQITGLAGVPPMWSILTQPSSSLHRHEFPNLRYITNSGGAMPIPVLQSLQSSLPKTEIYLMYGLTEAFRSTYLPPEELLKRPTSIGKAIPDTEIFVINEDGELCRPGEVGELVHRGPTVSMGYWGLPDETDKVLRPNPFLPLEIRHPEKVCYSGDLVKMDEEGFLYFAARRDHTIKSSGYRISPTEVEEVLYATGRIREAAVIGIPDEVLGQSIKAFVAPLDGKRLQGEELISSCAQRMPRYMVPRQIEIRAELPKTGSGKIDYQSLKRDEERKAKEIRDPA